MSHGAAYDIGKCRYTAFAVTRVGLDLDTWFAGQQIGLREEMDKAPEELERGNRPCQEASGLKGQGIASPGAAPDQGT